MQYLSHPTVKEQVKRSIPRMLEKFGKVTGEEVDEDGITPIHYYKNGDLEYTIHVFEWKENNNPLFHNPAREARLMQVFAKDGNPAMLPSIELFALMPFFVSVTPRLGSLLNYVTAHDTDKTKLKSIFMDLLYGVLYLHNHLRVAHLDLKPDNILLDANCNAVLSSFGCAVPAANADYEGAKAAMLQKLETRLQSRGASAQETEQRKQREIVKFDALYHQYAEMYHHLSAILREPDDEIGGPIARLPRLTVPLQLFFRPSYQQQGYTFDKILSINGYTDPNDPQMSGQRLVDSFLAHLRRQHPNEADQKRALANFTVRLMPNLPAKLYAFDLESGLTIPPAPIEGVGGTAQYMCPALARDRPTNPFAADVYSLGVVLFIVATGFQPYRSLTERAFQELERGGVAHLLRCYGQADSVYPTCLALLERMMHFDPDQRPTINECIWLFREVTLIPWTPLHSRERTGGDE